MKRKGRKSKRESTSNGVAAADQRQDENGDATDQEVTREDSVEREEKEKEKKRKSPGKRKSSSSKKSEVIETKEDSHDEDDEEARDFEEPEEKKRKPSKKEKRSSSRKSDAVDSKEEEDEPQYEVEQVLEEKLIRGVRHYLIRWKGYEPESDTWEPENTLSCDELINDFKKQKKNKGKAKSSKKREKGDVGKAKWDENEDFEVDRILDVYFRKNGKREFLVSWKGYPHSANSWEPEDNMDCKDLIKRYMDKVDKAKEAEPRELRLNRPHTDRLTLHTDVRGRRLSRRVVGKQRVRYHNAE